MTLATEPSTVPLANIDTAHRIENETNTSSRMHGGLLWIECSSMTGSPLGLVHQVHFVRFVKGLQNFSQLLQAGVNILDIIEAVKVRPSEPEIEGIQDSRPRYLLIQGQHYDQSDKDLTTIYPCKGIPSVYLSMSIYILEQMLPQEVFKLSAS